MTDLVVLSVIYIENLAMAICFYLKRARNIILESSKVFDFTNDNDLVLKLNI